MEKAKFVEVRKAKSGKIVGSIRFEDGKSMSVPSGVELTLDLINKECMVTREEGPIIQIVCEGKELINKPQIFSKDQVVKQPSVTPKIQREYQPNERPHTSNDPDYSAKAPYNFVPLNETLVGGEKPVDFSTYHQTRLTGYIQCELETLTPLYIRDTLNENEVANNLESNKHPDFFSPGGKCRIPGSSLRGMVRNLVEIMGWGKFISFQDKLLFYRGLADQSNLRQEYQANMSSYNRKTKKTSYKFGAGYLKREGLNCYIIPATVDNGGKQFKQVPKRDYNKEFVYEKYQDGKTLVVSGKMQGKKNDWLINSPNYQIQFKVSEQDIQAYKNDESRYRDKSIVDNDKKYDGDLLRLLSVNGNTNIPCFYVRWNDFRGNPRISFGHTGYFRLACQKTIGEHIPAELKDMNKMDIAETIFGSLSKIASRVYFEDAELIGLLSEDVGMPELTSKVLSSPKPTTFQHYLEQNEKADLKNLNHWNSFCSIRGHKLYWHKHDSVRFENKDKLIAINDIVIKPINKGRQFTCKIRFESLTEIELGALLFALDLPENHHHKLGMGKPLGLGTIKITPTLYLSDRKQRYSRLFNGDQWQSAERMAEIQKYKEAFEHYVLERISPKERNGADSLWAVERMKQLEAMLDWQVAGEANWEEETRYMQIEHPLNGNEFKKRPILEKPLEYRRRFFRKSKR
jgi:CRISPR/Cas system CSM-associated protein Csm3 (group 7 of RAMP superfamily)